MKMNPSTTELTLNLQLPNIATVSWAVQGDTLSRVITATLVDGSTPWIPQAGYNGVVRYRKPDNTVGVYDTDEEGNAAVTWTGNVATIKIVEQALTVPGTVIMQLEFYDTNDARVTAFGWANNVQPSIVTDTEFISTDYYNILTLQIAAVLEAAQIGGGAIILPTGDNTDRLTEITDRLSTYGYCQFVSGDYYISDTITLTDRQTLKGCGKTSRILKLGSSDIAPYVNITGTSQNATIEDLSFIGTLNAKPETYNTGNGDIAIGVYDHAGRVTIENCYFAGFNGAGITVRSGYEWLTSVFLTNCTFLYCNIGISLSQYGEFSVIANCAMNSCFYGAVVTGGNNKFVNCGFDGNDTGFVLYDNASPGTNDGHGSCVGSTFNHNTSNAMTITNIDNGYVFDACNMYYGDIYIANSSGIMFRNCIMLGNKDASNHTNITPYNCPGTVTLSGCLFAFMPTFSVTNSPYFYKRDCRTFSGSLISDPVLIAEGGSGSNGVVWESTLTNIADIASGFSNVSGGTWVAKWGNVVQINIAVKNTNAVPASSTGTTMATLKTAFNPVLSLNVVDNFGNLAFIDNTSGEIKLYSSYNANTTILIRATYIVQ